MAEEKTYLTLKEEGNQAYKNGHYVSALAKYTEGLKLTNEDKEKAVLLKNRAAVNLKIEAYEDVVKDCDEALELHPSDPKSLYRRGQAYELLNNHEKAYADMRAVQNLDPKNKDVQSALMRLHRVVQDKIEETTRMSGKVGRMFEIVFDVSAGANAEKRITAANNLVALAKEHNASTLLLHEGLLQKIVQLLKTEKNSEIRVACIRTLSQLSKEKDKAMKVLYECGLPWLLTVMNSENEEEVTAMEFCLQEMIYSISGMLRKKVEAPTDGTTVRARRPEIREHQKQLDSILLMVTASLTNRVMSGICRDSLIKILIKVIPYDALDWGTSFIRASGVEKLLDIASEVEEYRDECSISTTTNTRMTVSICLDKLYTSQWDDKARDRLIDMIDVHMKQILARGTPDSQVRCVVLITTMLLGPLDLGNAFIAKEGVLSMLLAMANTEEPLQQKVACEALIAAASKKDKCRSIMTDGTQILKRLYTSKDPAIKVRALVGLCKLGSLGGTDASMKPFAEGASLKLAEACRRFLVNPTKDKDMRRWSCEGLSYLTLDAEVKEKLIDDTAAIRSMLELAKSGDLNCVYGVVTTLVNLCNAYDTQEVLPEMLELAKFAKQHVPEVHDLDDKDFVDKRVNVLAKEGAGAALVALSKTDSENSKELIARLFLAMCEQQGNRGLMVQQGATKALLQLSTTSSNTAKGKLIAAHALARIAITINPETAFPGQRSYEVVRPFLSLLDIECNALENFEALLGLCNIAGMSEGARQRIIKEKGLSKIEHYMFEHHDLVRRAAVQCFVNMCMSPDVVKLMEGENDKFKYLVLCASDEDPEIVRAAAGGVCMVLGSNENMAKRIFDTLDWENILKFLVSHKEVEVAYRGSLIINLLIHSHKDIARRVINTHCKDALVALIKLEENPSVVLPKTQRYAKDSIDACVQMELISDPFLKDD